MLLYICKNIKTKSDEKTNAIKSTNTIRTTSRIHLRHPIASYGISGYFIQPKTLKMEFKGTKGEWCVNGKKYPTIESKNNNKNIIVTYPTIATVNSTFRTIEESQANALLISKAPKMLEKLKEVLPLISSIEKSENKTLTVGITQLIKEATEL